MLGEDKCISLFSSAKKSPPQKARKRVQTVPAAQPSQKRTFTELVFLGGICKWTGRVIEHRMRRVGIQLGAFRRYRIRCAVPQTRPNHVPCFENMSMPKTVIKASNYLPLASFSIPTDTNRTSHARPPGQANSIILLLYYFWQLGFPAKCISGFRIVFAVNVVWGRRRKYISRISWRYNDTAFH